MSLSCHGCKSTFIQNSRAQSHSQHATSEQPGSVAVEDSNIAHVKGTTQIYCGGLSKSPSERGVLPKLKLAGLATSLSFEQSGFDRFDEYRRLISPNRDVSNTKNGSDMSRRLTGMA